MTIARENSPKLYFGDYNQNKLIEQKGISKFWSIMTKGNASLSKSQVEVVTLFLAGRPAFRPVLSDCKGLVVREECWYSVGF